MIKKRKLKKKHLQKQNTQTELNHPLQKRNLQLRIHLKKK